jgi:hypothetical protein
MDDNSHRLACGQVAKPGFLGAPGVIGFDGGWIGG